MVESLPLSYYAGRLGDVSFGTHRDLAATTKLIARMVLDGPEGSTQLLVDLLEGRHGNLAGALAYRSIETGISIGNGSPLDAVSPMVASFAEVCMFKGRLTMLEAVLDVSPRDSCHNTRSLSKSDYLDYLCSTVEGRAKDPSAFEDGRMEGLVGLAAQNWDLSVHARAALDMAWAINPEHPAWERYFYDQSGPGAFVREYLMTRRVAGASVPVGTEPARTRRAGRAL